MTYKLMTNPATGQVGLFVENGTTGTWDDPNASRNAPLITPISFLDKIKFHSDLDHFEVAFAGSIAVTHSAVTGVGAAGRSSSGYATGAGTDDNLLVTHSLGYVPFALVAAGSNILWPGMPVLNTSDGTARYASAYADTTALRVFTSSTAGVTSLSATAVTYSYLVFKNPPAAAGNVMFDFDPATGIVRMGFGKFHSDAPYLQVVSGGSPLGMSNGRTIDLYNGAPKAWRPDGTTYAPVPTGLSEAMPHVSFTGGYSSTFGNTMEYTGSYGGPPTSIQVQAP